MSFYLESEEMVMFGRKKLIEENSELKSKVEEMESLIERMKNTIESYEQKENEMLNGKHFPGATCKRCKYLVEEKEAFCTRHSCVLNSKCKDKVLAE